MKQVILRSLAIGAVALAFAVPAIAQGPGGPGGRPGGFGPPNPQMMKWFQAHKHIMQINGTVRGLSDMEKSPTTALNRHQAAKVLSILAEWRHKPVMTDSQAADIDAKIHSILNPAQRTALAAASSRRFGGGGPGGRPGGMGGRPGGPGARPAGMTGGRPGGPGGRPGGVMGGRGGGPGGGGGMMKPYNPLNPSTLPFQRMQGRAQQRLDGLISKLAATAKGH